MLAKEQIFNQVEEDFGRIELMCNELAAYLSDQYSRKIVGIYDGDGAKEYYQSSSPEEQKAVFKSLVNYYSLIIDAVSKDVDLNDSATALRHSLEWNGLATYDEIFTEITKDSVIEMFDLKFCQFWRSDNFFKHSSHSLAALFCKPFNLNFKKEPPEVEHQIIGAATALLTDQKDFILDVTKAHKIIEIGAREGIENRGTVKYASILLKQNEIVGVISLINLSKINKIN
ncbi:MAG: hypothetical protein ACRBBP_02005 [Bdellovibrionales bacterium]